MTYVSGNSQKDKWERDVRNTHYYIKAHAIGIAFRGERHIVIE